MGSNERKHDTSGPGRVRLRLTRKYAEVINGVDLSGVREGQTLDLSQRDAEILLAEGWAEYERHPQSRDIANETPRRPHRRR